MRKLLIALLACVLGATSAHAQSTKAQINAEITTNFPDNTVGAITPAGLRAVTSDIVNSIMPTAPVVSGNLACFNGLTGLLQDCGASPTGIYTTLSGDCTATSAGVITCTKTNGVLFGTMATQNANAVAITGGTAAGLSSLGVTNNQNAGTFVTVTNNSAGTSAIAGFSPQNGTGIGSISVGGTNLSTTLLQNRLYINGAGTLGGIVITNDAAQPIIFGISGVEVGRWSSSVPGRLITGLTGTTTGSIDFSGATSGATTLTAAAAGSGTLTLPAATDTLVGKATTDTLTNKTFDTAGAGNSFSIASLAVTANQGTGAMVRTASPQITTPNIVGTTAVGNAAAGSVGEYPNSVIAQGSAVALTTATAANMTTISLTAGDWDVWATFNFTPAASTNITQCLGSISTTSATANTAGDRVSFIAYASAGGVVPAVNLSAPMVQTRINVSSTTSVFAVSQCSFTVSTLGAWGSLQARRVR